MTTQMSTDLFSPVSLVPVTFRSKVPTEALAAAVMLTVAFAALPSAGTVTLPGAMPNVTPLGGIPTHAAERPTSSLTPLVERSAIVEDFIAGLPSASDAGEAAIV
jgi:hypothetical protein